MHCGHFLIYYANHLSSNHSRIIRQSSLAYISRHLVAKQGDIWRETPVILPVKYLCHTPQGFLTWSKILWHGADGFTSPPKEIVLQIFIALENPSSSAEFEPKNLGSNGKHNNHNTTENDMLFPKFLVLPRVRMLKGRNIHRLRQHNRDKKNWRYAVDVQTLTQSSGHFVNC
jgi:hypothetical protein